MKYIIHSCEKRLWYVKEYFIPSLIKQGISEEDIIIWNDDQGWGCLKSWTNSCEWVKENLDIYDGCWHLQDDVLVCHDFKERTANPPMNDIVCGYIAGLDHIKEEDLGKHQIDKIQFSFPCTWIPNRYIVGFIDWFNKEVATGKYMPNLYKKNKFDDLFFMKYMKKYHKNTYTYNLDENLVEHICDLIGGAIVTKYLKNRARNFKDQYLVKELEEELKKR